MASETDVDVQIDAERQSRSEDAAIAALAAAQHGVVSRAQLVTLGLGHGAIDRRVARRRLHPVHRGVFAVGHTRLSRFGHWSAAVLALGPGAVLSHRSAAALWGIRDTSRRDVDVTAARQRRPRRGIEPHHIVLPADEVTVERGIPVTTPARTVLDLAVVLAPHQLERALHEAEYRRLTSPLPLGALIARHPNRRGIANLARILDDLNERGAMVTRSVLEERFLPLLDAHQIPRPKTNEPIGPYTVDALWPDHRLVVELDSRQAHETTHAFENDRARDRHLQTHGYKVLRITWRELHEDRATIAAQLRALTDTVATP
jgi:very-short-patch-repair endonuclease